METILLTYRSKEYSGYIVSSNSELPHYHWVYLNDRSLINTVGDCISFTENGQDILWLAEKYSSQHEELLNIIQHEVEDYLINKHQLAHMD